MSGRDTIYSVQAFSVGGFLGMGFKVRWCTVMVSRVKDLGGIMGFGIRGRGSSA